MSLIELATRAVESLPLPDAVTLQGIEFLVGRTNRRLATLSAGTEQTFANTMTDHPIAEHTDAANEQHYELPPEFFVLTLGPRRKYSSCLYPTGTETLAQAEECALAETISHADLKDGQRILELGCGWGSLTLYMAGHFPGSQIVAVSNSAPQRAYIEGQAKAAGFTNVTVITADMNEFQPEGLFDRVVSVEMFEHMANWTTLLARVRSWLKADGRLFIHVFTHRNQPYRFDTADKADWIAQHFFTGGIMPSRGLIGHFPESFNLEQQWHWSGRHYQQTAIQWLGNFDANRARIDQLLREVYGDLAPLWRRRWRLFYLATAGLFGHADGDAWGVSHYLLKPSV